MCLEWSRGPGPRGEGGTLELSPQGLHRSKISGLGFILSPFTETLEGFGGRSHPDLYFHKESMGCSVDIRPLGGKGSRVRVRGGCCVPGDGAGWESAWPPRVGCG